MMESVFRKSLVTAVITVSLDFLFHVFLTHPMETLTYFVIKFLLAFFVATGLFSWHLYTQKKEKRRVIVPVTGLIFSTLMSAYYRAWEWGEAHVPFSSRAPDILGIPRESLLFAAAWWLGHALFFAAGAMAAEKLVKK
mgnify:CR=1 FL=1